jgi:aryl-alcohol dehydrogenase-like predicted oxidoreductase
MGDSRIKRRDLLQTSGWLAAGIPLGAPLAAMAASSSEHELITKKIPSSGQRLPVVGVGTNQFGTDDPETLDRIRTVLRELPKHGGRVVDTAESYGDSESVIGRLTDEIGNRDELFLATKTASRGDVTVDDIMAAFDRLKTDRIDLVQVHNFNHTDQVIPHLDHLRKAGKIRYVGCSTSSDDQYHFLKSAMNKHHLDFIQIDYSIDNRSAASEILPMAEEKGLAVLANMPFGGRRNAASIFEQVADVELPDWAAEIAASNSVSSTMSPGPYCLWLPCRLPGLTR